MGFNRRKLEDQRRETAEKEAASRRATDAQALEEAERLIARLERAPGQTNADAILADHRRGCRGWLLVSLGALSDLPNDQCD
jgi:hypothetical protein